ncbi:hypothetical protein PSTT_16838 [Puccinia striiformis]|uniref:Uncharacterized protein n=1 Tax=Puccinia striiformis TaxID=27350 RepID=A0A2S4UB79_9BASI|nr:hypothetical protein PSTT_16838 [Puccinia striiformis]
MRCEGFCAGFHTLSSTSQRFPVRLRQKRDALFPDVSKHREDIVEETLAGARGTEKSVTSIILTSTAGKRRTSTLTQVRRRLCTTKKGRAEPVPTTFNVGEN